jgi:hypothetical protein
MAPSRISRRMSVVLFALPVLAVATACDPNESSSPKAKPAAEASSSVAAPPAPKPPAPPAAPVITVDEASCTVDGEVVQMGAADASGRIAAVLAGKPFVEGEVVSFDASRDTRTPKVAAVLQALKKMKAKAAVVHTKQRDSSMGQLQLSLEHPAIGDCSATAMLNKDGSIAVWPAGGGGAKRFTRGFAGPDLTLGSQAVQKVASSCDSAVWLLAADDSLPWALPFDLALATVGSGEGGAIRASHTVLLGAPPVAGRKVTE